MFAGNLKETEKGRATSPDGYQTVQDIVNIVPVTSRSRFVGVNMRQ